MLCWFGYSEKMSCKMEKHSCESSTCLFSGYVTVAGSAVRTKQEKHYEGYRYTRYTGTMGAFHLGKKPGNFGGSKSGISDW